LTSLLESKNILPGFKSLCNIFWGISDSEELDPWNEVYEVVFSLEVAVLLLEFIC
jgi:hypothetical protein